MAALTMKSQGKGWSIWTDGKQLFIKIERVVCSFPSLGAQKVSKDEETGKERSSWQITPMLKKGVHDEVVDKFRAIMNKLLKDNEYDDPNDMEEQYKCLKDGDKKKKDRPEYAGHWIISASDSKRRPTVRKANGEVMTSDVEIDNKFYGGCVVNVMLRPWFFNGIVKNVGKKFPKRISCGIVAAQFVEDGAPFGEGRVDDTNAWGAVDDSDDDGLGSSKGSDDDEI